MSEENKRKAAELSEEETAQAAGGKDETAALMTCQNCGRAYAYQIDQPEPRCPYCGYKPNSCEIEIY